MVEESKSRENAENSKDEKINYLEDVLVKKVDLEEQTCIEKFSGDFKSLQETNRFLPEFRINAENNDNFGQQNGVQIDTQEYHSKKYSSEVQLSKGWKKEKEKESLWLPIMGVILSFILPPVGCIIFLLCVGSDENSRCYKWAVRGLFVGSFLSFLYSLMIAMFIADLVVKTNDKQLLYGVSYS